jgi:hypothetical protein
MPNVIQKYYSGAIKDHELLDEIDEAVEEWHTSGDKITEPLHVFLGMCFPEYALWVTSPSKFVAQMHHQSYYPMFWGLTD